MSEATFRRIAADRALDFMAVASGQGRPYGLFDTRDPASYAQDHLPGALRLSERDLGEWIGRLPRTEPVLIYCYHGNASQVFAQAFADFGFAEVYSIDGGFQALALSRSPSTGRPVPSPTLLAFMAKEGGATAELDAAAAHGMTPLMKAARAARLDLVEELIALGVDLEARNTDGNTALWLACFGGDAAVVQRLIAAGARLDNQNDTGATALMYCASTGRDGLVGLLLDAGADAQLQTQDDFRAVDLAATAGSLRLLRHTV
jgi:rhodanese-related sulfurtransferase